MRYICLRYIEPGKWESLTDAQRNAMMEECFAYDDVLRKSGHFAGGEALQDASTAVTLRWQNGKVAVTDGPYAETKEQLGGILILEANDLNHAIQLMSQHPGAAGRAVRDSPGRGKHQRTGGRARPSDGAGLGQVTLDPER